MAKTNLDSGFLILYDWLPALRSLDGDELKNLLFALIEHQKNGAPLPDFENPLTAIFAQMIAPTIKRRLDGLVSATKSSKSTSPKREKSKSKPQDPRETNDTDSDEEDLYKSNYTPKATHAENMVEVTVEDTLKDMLKGKLKDTVEGTVEGSLNPRKEEIRKAEISGAKWSGAEISGADSRPRVSDAEISGADFARKLMEDLVKNPPKKIYRE